MKNLLKIKKRQLTNSTILCRDKIKIQFKKILTLLTTILILPLFLYPLFNYFLASSNKVEIDLEVCLDKDLDQNNYLEYINESKFCKWKKIKVGQFLTSELEQIGSEWLIFRFAFDPEKTICKKEKIFKGCSLFTEAINGSNLIFVNRRLASSFGKLPPEYSYLSGVTILAEFGPSDVKNKIVEAHIVNYAPEKRERGIAFPIKIIPSSEAKKISKFYTFGISYLPIVGTAVISILIFCILAAPFSTGNRSGHYLYIVGYMFFAMLSLISLSRLPREFFSNDVFLNINFIIQFITVYLYLEAIKIIDQSSSTISEIIFKRLFIWILLIQLVMLIFLIFDFKIAFHHNEIIMTVANFAVSLYPIQTLFAMLRLKKSLLPYRLKKIISVVLFLILSMSINDAIVFNDLAFGYYFSRVIYLINSLLLFFIFLREGVLSYIELQSSAKIFRISQNILHDMRSPLAALDVLISHKNSLGPSELDLFEKIISRIKAIANQITNSGQDAPPKAINIENIYKLLNDTIEEKKIEYKDKKNISMQLKFDALVSFEQMKSIFLLIQPGEFCRIMSNLINNSIDALTENEGAINVEMIILDKEVQISIQDNGKGIPKDVLKNLGTKRFSYDKEHNENSGSGLGILQAKETIEHWDGRLEIDSILKQGTIIKILLPLPRQFQK